MSLSKNGPKELDDDHRDNDLNVFKTVMLFAKIDVPRQINLLIALDA